MAKEYRVLPKVAERDLFNDPEQLALVCIDINRFAEAKAVYDSADKQAIAGHSGTKMMARVQEIAFEFAAEGGRG